MSTAFRQELRAGCYAVLTTYQAANPTKLATVYAYPPESYATPCAYVEKTVNERIVHSASTRQRVLTVNVVLVTKLISNKQATDEQDFLVDALMDAFSAAYHGASGTTLMQPITVTDTEIAAGDGVRYAAAIFTIEGSDQLGRP